MAARRTAMAEVTATEAKNSFGAVLDRALAGGGVAIVKHRRPAAVLLSMAEYEALVAGAEDPLQRLRGEFDTLVDDMQSARAAAAGRRLFEVSPRVLGRAAKIRAQRTSRRRS